MFTFILGAVTGGLAAWWWRNDIQRYVSDRMPTMREKAADRLSAIEQRAEGALGKARARIDQMRTGESRPRSYTQGTGV